MIWSLVFLSYCATVGPNVHAIRLPRVICEQAVNDAEMTKLVNHFGGSSRRFCVREAAELVDTNDNCFWKKPDVHDHDGPGY